MRKRNASMMFTARALATNYAAKTVAFTLLELLVVIASIALLSALLLPAFANTRNNVKPTGCASNLKQWAAAEQMYASENGDQIPRDGFASTTGIWGTAGTDFSGTPDDQYGWFNLLPPYAGETTMTYYYHQPGSDPRLKFPFPGNNLGKIWMCPSATMNQAGYNVLLSGDGGQYGFFSYTFNIDLKRNNVTDSGAYVYPAMPKLASLPNPSATVLLQDGPFDPLTEQVNPSPQYNSDNPGGRWTSSAIRHTLGGFLAFCDGHVQYFRHSYLTNNPNHTTDPPCPDVIWNPVYRAANPLP